MCLAYLKAPSPLQRQSCCFGSRLRDVRVVDVPVSGCVDLRVMMMMMMMMMGGRLLLTLITRGRLTTDALREDMHFGEIVFPLEAVAVDVHLLAELHCHGDRQEA